MGKQSIDRWLWPWKRVIKGLVWAFCLLLVLLFVMFSLTKGPAYIFFEEDSAAGSLRELRSSCIRIEGADMAVDITGDHYGRTRICGKQMVLFSETLSDRVTDGAGLLLEKTEPFEIEICFGDPGGTKRYFLREGQRTDMDPSISGAVRSSFRELQLYPQVTAGEAWESFAAVPSDMTIRVPADVQVSLIYSDGRKEAPVPEHLAEELRSFSLCDTDLKIRAVEDPLEMTVEGQYALKLSCVNGTGLQGYLTGSLQFRNTSTPKRYELTGQLVEMESRTHGLQIPMTRDLRQEPQRENTLRISGEADRMEIAGADSFPNLAMWLRETIYLAPLSLLSAVISLYGLSSRKKNQKVRVRKVKKVNQ